MNGTVRVLFPNADWFGIDCEDGPDVDLVVDAIEYDPVEPADLVICCEVFEHAEQWAAIIRRAAGWLKVGGEMIITVAGPQRPPHSAFDGGEVRPGEYYGNVSAEALVGVAFAAGLRGYAVTVRDGQDVYYRGTLCNRT